MLYKMDDPHFLHFFIGDSLPNEVRSFMDWLEAGKDSLPSRPCVEGE